MRKNIILILSGAVFMVAGIAGTVFMFVCQTYPTFLYFLFIAIGLLQALVALFFKDIKSFIQVAIVAFPIITFYTLYLFNKPSEDTILIPLNFRGRVYIYYDQPSGAPQEYEHGRRLYRIPNDGILLTQSSLKGHIVALSSSEYYLEDSLTHKRYRLPQGGPHERTDSNTLQVIYGECGLSSHYGIYQTIDVGTPTRVFFERSISTSTHDSIMSLKVKNINH